MKVLMLTPDCYMIDRRILLEAKTLTKAGYKVILLAGFECPEEEHYFADGIEIYRYRYDWDDERLKKIRAFLPDNDKLKMFMNRVYLYFARRLFGINPFEQFMLTKLLQFEADIYHVHDLPSLKVGVYASHERAIPLIYDAHELYYAQETLSPSLQKLYYKIERKYIRHTDVVITVNNFIAQLMAERYRIKTPEVIMNCAEVPENFVPENKSLIRNKGTIPADWKIVLYQGWISPERNIETLIRGARYFQEKCCLVIIGYGAHEFELKRLARDEGLENKVFFLGKVPSDEMINYTTGSDIAVIPYRPIDDNHLYCSPNKLFEYVLAGVPVVTDDLPFFRKIKNEYGFICITDMGSSEAFGKTVNEILASPEKIKDLKFRCNEASKELNWEVEGQKLLEIYKKVKK
ncbi:MAG: glycosyltransferase [Bacillota bacterium]